jgi:hypothetical protein
MKDLDLLKKLKDELQDLKTSLAVKQSELSKISKELEDKYKITSAKQADKDTSRQ